MEVPLGVPYYEGAGLDESHFFSAGLLKFGLNSIYGIESTSRQQRARLQL